MGTSQRDYDVRLSKLYTRLNLGDTLAFGSLDQILDVLNLGVFSDLYVRSHDPADSGVTVNGATLVQPTGSLLVVPDTIVSLAGYATLSNYNNLALSMKHSTGNVSVVAGTENANPLLIVDPIFKSGEIPLAFVQVQGATPVVVQTNITDHRQLVSNGFNSDYFGSDALASLATSKTVTFSTALPAGTIYYIVGTIENTVDANPQYQPFVVTNKTITGFTIKWNAPLDSANYRIIWKLIFN